MHRSRQINYALIGAPTWRLWALIHRTYDIWFSLSIGVGICNTVVAALRFTLRVPTVTVLHPNSHPVPVARGALEAFFSMVSKLYPMERSSWSKYCSCYKGKGDMDISTARGGLGRELCTAKTRVEVKKEALLPRPANSRHRDSLQETLLLKSRAGRALEQPRRRGEEAIGAGLNRSKVARGVWRRDRFTPGHERRPHRKDPAGECTHASHGARPGCKVAPVPPPLSFAYHLSRAHL